MEITGADKKKMTRFFYLIQNVEQDHYFADKCLHCFPIFAWMDLLQSLTKKAMKFVVNTGTVKITRKRQNGKKSDLW